MKLLVSFLEDGLTVDERCYSIIEENPYTRDDGSLDEVESWYSVVHIRTERFWFHTTWEKHWNQDKVI